ncbi:HNH endonuclease signature motif containing protein [Actinotalea solisilvae]|uniref:HNH endonuclease signature motif containing protein n=1 Tax=Actinotalea solisilvae TaxID=2072922 RepID=UPI0018F24BB9|nr:HNH endonuclease signature motif containing protein [Actinotalea solisilvae]
MRHRVAAELEESAPGPELAARLDALEPADLDEAALVEGIAAWERIASWAAAGQAWLVAELDGRQRGARGAFLSEEVAARLSVSRPVAEAKVGLALHLDRVPAVAGALARGDVDVRRATVLTDELARLSDAAAAEVAEAVLPSARECTAPQLRQRLRRMELLRDPDGARTRHARACADRRVELTPAPDAMAWLSAYLPADDAAAIHTSLTALAGDAAPDDERTLDQRRADALVDLATRWLDAGAHPDGTPLATRQGRRPHLVVTASAATLLGLAEGPGELQGYGPIPPEMARRIAAHSTWEPLLASAWNGEPLARSTRRYAPTQSQRDAVVLRDSTCTFVGCRMPAARCDVDHVEPYVEGGDVDGRDGAPCATQPQTSLDNLQALCRHHHRAKTHGGWEVARDDDGSTRWRAPTGQLYRRPPAHDPPAAVPAPPPPDGVTIDLYPPPPF